MDSYPLIPPPMRRRSPWQFSIRSLFLLTAVVAVGATLFKHGGLAIVAGMLVAMLALVVIAKLLSQLPAPFAGAACVASLIGVAVAAIAVSDRWYEIRELLARWLGPSINNSERMDLVAFWACVLGSTIALGAILGWGMSLSQERN